MPMPAFSDDAGAAVKAANTAATMATAEGRDFVGIVEVTLALANGDAIVGAE